MVIFPRDPEAPAGWYPDDQDPAMLRWWDGRRWTRNVRSRWSEPAAPPASPSTSPEPPMQPVVYVPAGQPRWVGISTGEHLGHAVLTVLTCGLWGVIWFLRAHLGRRRIS